MVAIRHIACHLVTWGFLARPTEAQDVRVGDQHSGGSDSPSTATFCEAWTINYITHTLPQLCLASDRRSAIYTHHAEASASAATATIPNLGHDSDDDPYPTVATNIHASATQTDESDAENTEETSPSEAVASPFMSFEDWKEMMLRRTGQDPQDLRSRQATRGRGHERTPPDMGHYGLGEEDEISLDFNGYLEKPSTDQAAPPDLPEGMAIQDQRHDAMVYDGDKPSLHRSKDAGKTCKERFSYASFDAGATILKTSRGAKNPKAILVENKDSYMLLECAAESKYVIVELSDDILIDTIVLANFEFFSSMIRQFQVSVSDRYPVKMDRWRDVGTFEARNSRDIQAFLVENPQIWAKYVRIQFLSHYGNEYYCPVSLLRVHGSRMLDSWKDDEAGREEELSVEDDHGAGLTNTENATLDGAIPDPLHDDGEPGAAGLNFTPWAVNPWDSFGSLYGTCQLGTLMADEASHFRPNASKEEPGVSELGNDEGKSEDDAAAQAPSKHQVSNGDERPSSYLTPTVSPTRVMHDSRPTTKHNPTSANTTAVSEGAGNNSTAATKHPTPVAPPAGKARSTGTSTASAASPTVQEGFFNAITKRLQHVESNLTLSLQYLEDQSRYMQDALQKAEQKQLSKVTVFLENLNQTVMAELRGMRDQYEQLWQSTVIALESQKEQSDRDIVALSSRLNLLADEVVFQKRMAIAQADLVSGEYRDLSPQTWL
ncbi:hypothetical protein ACRE_061180 [Hapsidospora chrysogenum ATCC 11550]|uniref:SUN domain-containing protein n=1 Tax=Hapsidospora chrysogenum (strain ATCC 11550 / CBS 779.69 / DSM 880 / IAM 14645 / JCM 23072 / IMI 49137) TaxID=857340 RepID=A0A086T164_HAPC1|nr:hypothetical protein ACRE_061180 [Hapsidospora chrysogenum ATCC 11550]